MSDTPSVEDGESCCPTMSSQAKNIGFIVCLAVGIGITLIEINSIRSPTTTFAIWLLIGDALILGSSLFMSSLKTQWKKMMHPVRATTTIVLLASIACTVVFSLIDSLKPLTAFAAIVQYCALFWYVLSLIPGGQKCCTTCINSCCGACCGCVKGATA